MLRKLEKARRYWSWRLKPTTNAPLFWHVGRPNFGDDINPSFLQQLSGQGVRFAADRARPHLLGVGSILESATERSTVLGSGYLRPDSGPLPQQTRVVSLRGERSLELAGCDAPGYLGDPLVLVDILYNKPIEKKYDVGLVAHVLSINEMKTRYGGQVHLISPAQPPWQVVEEIAACRRVVSQSLHGLIVADAFEVPNLWLAPSEMMAGGRFKFDDYFSTLDEPKPPIVATDGLFQHLSAYPFLVSQFKYSKTQYQAALTKAIAALANPITFGFPTRC